MATTTHVVENVLFQSVFRISSLYETVKSQTSVFEKRAKKKQSIMVCLFPAWSTGWFVSPLSKGTKNVQIGF